MYQPYGKRALDIILSTTILPIIIPMTILICILIKLESPKERVFFTQKRIGQHGKTFKIFKFRTMKTNNDEILREYLKKHPEEIKNYSLYHKYKHDPRITKIGRFLRKTSLDEVPQIINIFKGEMTLVGPRPYLIEEKEKMGVYFKKITRHKPGLTGEWQINGRNNITFHNRLILESNYSPSFTKDLKIIVLTVLEATTGK